MSTDTDSRTEAGAPTPVCVTLSGGLLANDLLGEAALTLMKRRPSSILRLPGWLMRGRGTLNREVASRIGLEAEHLPYDQACLRYLAAQRDAGRPVILVSDHDPSYSRSVADHLGLFDDVVVLEDSGRGEVGQRLVERFGRGGFDFVTGANPPAGMAQAARQVLEAPRQERRPGWLLIARALRVHQWLKNLLVFLPVLAAQMFTEPGTLIRAVMAFFAFSFVASSVYVINDLLDLPEDRKHRSKRRRPFASGELPIRTAPYLLAAMLGSAVILCLFLPPAFAGVLLGYLVLTFAYSLKLKGAVLLDAITLAGLYSIRVIAGSAATDIEPSVWLLGFSLFFFMSLALVKRYAELHRSISDGKLEEDTRLPGRSYQPGDLPVLVALGVGTGCMAVLVLALYVISDEMSLHYRYPFLLWQLCPLVLYWLGRAWIVVSRDEMTDDPVVWAVKDQMSRWVAVIAVLILVLAR
ncbi:MAG: UbiA family prenyltransferase [Gemmatimonadota bacterium]|jgi:4-hydroxybenzoate polyprenyltransferase